MALEAVCPNCEGRLVIADPDSVVACPHCGTELSAAGQPENAFAGLSGIDGGSASSAPDFSALVAPADGEATEELVVGPVEDADASPAASESVVSSSADGGPRDAATAAETGSAVLTASEHSTAASQPETTEEEADAGSEPSRSRFAAPPPANGSGVLPARTRSGTHSPEPEKRGPASPGVSRLAFVLLLSYASAVTLFLAYLLYVVRFGEPHPLESLPDVVPNYRETLPDVEPVTDKNGKVLPQIVAEDAEMPVGHTLRLGETQRFGNVRVTPLKVTREMLEFVHYSGDEQQTRPAAGPVLKLWLKFENASEDQTFAPLDRELLYLRGPTQRDRYGMHANNFVAAVDEKRPDGDLVLVYDLVLTDVWDPKDQSLGSEGTAHLLKPGEEMVTYIPTEPQGIDALDGELVWRVHFRKGYNPESGRGVTTLIEVVFDAESIRSEI